jgi:hypothetical protein
VLGIDVVYEPELVECLPKVVKQHLLSRSSPPVAVGGDRGGGDDSGGGGAAVVVVGEPAVAAEAAATDATTKVERSPPADPGWLSTQPGEPSPCAYFVCPAREPSTVALFINSCVAEGLSVRVTAIGAQKVGARNLSYLAGPGTGAPDPMPKYPSPPTDACLLVRCWMC